MSVVIDELITKFTLDDQSYAKGGKAMLSITHSITSAVDSLMGKISGGLHSAIRSLLSPISMLVGAAGISGLIVESAKAAMSFDYLSRSMIAVTHDAKRAQDVMKFVDKLSIPSIFHDSELAQAAERLEAMGLATEKYLPMAEKLGTVFGGSSEQLMEFVDALGRIKGGMSGRGFEVLERAGMSKDQFKEMGLQFSKAGELLSPIDKALDAVVNLVQKKFGMLNETVGGSYQAKWATFTNSIEKAFRSIGTVLLDFAMPAVEKLAEGLQKMVERGDLTKITQGFTNLFHLDPDSLIKGLEYVDATLMVMPRVLVDIKNYALSLFEEVKSAAGVVGKAIVALFAFSTIAKGLQLIIGLMTLYTTVTTAAAGAQAVLDALTPGGLILLAGAAEVIAQGFTEAADAYDKFVSGMQKKLPKFGDYAAEIQKTVDMMEADRHKKSLGETITDAINLAVSASSAQNQQTGYLRQIEEHTKQSATDLKRYALGGGDLGRLGVTPTEMQGFYGANKGLGHGVSKGTNQVLINAIEAVIGDILGRRLAGAARQRVLQ